MQDTAQALSGNETDQNAIADINVWEKSEKALVMVRAAQKIFFSHGFFAATTDMIQKEAGVSKSTLYQYYKSKEGMFIAVIAWTCKNRIRHVQMDKLLGENVRERLFDLGEKFFTVLLNEEAMALYRIVIEVSQFFPRVSDFFYKTWKQVFFPPLANILVGAAQKGEICLMESEVPQAAELFYSMIRGEIFVKLLLFPQNEPDDRQVSAWIAFSVDKFLAAYRPGC